MRNNGRGADKHSGDNTIAIMADVIRARVPSDEQIERGVRTPQLKEVKNCRVELISDRIAGLSAAWKVSLKFRVTVNYTERKGAARVAERLFFFDKEIPFPPGVGAKRMIPRATIANLSCEAIPLLKQGLDHVLTVIRFQLTVKGVVREEVTLLLPPSDA